AQVSAGNLPTPDATSVFAVYFPPGITLKQNQGGLTSCVAGGFCAYHSLTPEGSVRFSAIADQSPRSRCDVGCGKLGGFDNLTTVSAHELVEALTDPGGALATSLSSPLGWYDFAASGKGEIADICQSTTDQGTVTGANGSTATVQKVWSNT